ncbi:MAG: CCA tRNA nucleotidyltransferase [Tepidisphaeraceae bacterium]
MTVIPRRVILTRAMSDDATTPSPQDTQGATKHATHDDALAVVKRLRDAGHVAYFAGGCVRDMLLGLTPTDYDVATDATPDRVRQLFSNTQAVGAAFGVILVRHRKSQIEVATFRSDGNYTDGRRPDKVVFTTAAEDAKRRDFTINGMFYDPVEEKVIDYVGGQEDLKNKVLRAIGNPEARFREDWLRMLRAVRFAARFDLHIDDATATPIKTNYTLISGVSPERTAEELRAMLTPLTRNRAWALLRRFHLLQTIFRVHHRHEPGPGHGASGIFAEVAPGQTIPFGLALAAASLAYLWPRAGGGDVRDLCVRASVNRISQALRRSLKISNEETDILEGTLSGVGLMLQDQLPTTAMLKRFLARPMASSSRELLNALARVAFHRHRIEPLIAVLAELEQTNFAPAPLITGDDLTAAGLSPGPVFRRVLDAVYDAQLEDRVKTKDAAMELAMSLSRAHPSG